MYVLTNLILSHLRIKFIAHNSYMYIHCHARSLYFKIHILDFVPAHAHIHCVVSDAFHVKWSAAALRIKLNKNVDD